MLTMLEDKLFDMVSEKYSDDLTKVFKWVHELKLIILDSDCYGTLNRNKGCNTIAGECGLPISAVIFCFLPLKRSGEMS